MLWGDGSVISRFVYGSHASTPDLLLLPNGSVFRIISDQLGSPRVVVAVNAGGIAAGTIVRKIDYDEFGSRSVTMNTGALGDLELPLGFAGGLYDPDTGFVHFGARDYDPSVGRWTSKDPIRFGGGSANLYVYAGNDPVNRVDRSGLRDWSAAETQAILNDAIEEYVQNTKLGAFCEAFANEGGLFRDARYDFRFSARFKRDTFYADGQRMNSSEFGNYFAGYVNFAVFGQAGVDLSHLGGAFLHAGAWTDDPMSVSQIDRGAFNAAEHWSSSSFDTFFSPSPLFSMPMYPVSLGY